MFQIVTTSSKNNIFTNLFVLAEIFQEHEWIETFLKFCICGMEQAWMQKYRADEHLTRSEDKEWEEYFILIPTMSSLGNNSTEDETKQYLNLLHTSYEIHRKAFYKLCESYNVEEKVQTIALAHHLINFFSRRFED